MPPRAAARTRKPGEVESAVRAFVLMLKDLDPLLAVSPEAAAALSLARIMDETGNSATSRGICAKELREHVARLRELAPEKRAVSPLDEIRARREKRIARAADTTG